MSKIERLQIMGVRSFDNRVPQRIQFFSPLTLIVGYNGSGKTTIIECLKYATTGELPPNSKGGAFIHDPSLCGEKEVMALVHARFTATNGNSMDATRRLTLTVKKTTRSQKTTECNLTLRHNHERTSLSSRVAEIDQMIPQYLGVSKAILEFVIFCHQDDSLWPMSEPSVLKKRFDEIFEAMKYTKAIDNIKILRKKQTEELNKYKIIEQHAKEDKDKGDRAEKRSQDLYEEIEELRASAEALGQQHEEASAKAKDAWQHASRFATIVAELKGKCIAEEALTGSVQELKQHLKEMTDTDEELQAIESRYEERTAVYQQDNDRERRLYTDLQGQIDDTRGLVGSKQSEIGKYEAQKDQYERQIESRENLVKETARRHDIRGFELEVTDEHVRDFMEKIQKMARDQQAALDRARQDLQQETQDIQTVLNRLGEQKSTLNQSKNYSRSQISMNDQSIAQYQRDHDSIEIDEAGKVTLEATIEELSTKLQQAKSAFVSAQWDAKAKSIEDQLRTLEDQKSALGAELIQATRQANETARVDYLHKELKERRRNVETMSGAHGARIAQVVGSQWTPANLERDYQSAVEQKEQDVREVEMQRDGTKRELEQVDFRLSTLRNDLKRKRGDREQSKKTVYDATGEEDPSAFPEYLEELEDACSKKAQEASNSVFLKDYYSSCIRTADRHNACELCSREFKDKQKEKFIRRIQEKLEGAVKEELQKEAEQLAADLKDAKSAATSYDTWNRLQSEIPGLETEEKSLDTRRNALVSKLEQQDNLVRERQESKRDVESINRTVQTIVKYHNEIGNYESQIEELASKQADGSVSRGLEQIQEDIQQTNEESRKAMSTQKQIAFERDTARTQITNLEFEEKDVQSKLQGADFQLKEKASLIKQMDDLRTRNTEHRESLRKADSDLETLTPQIEQEQVKLDDARHRGNQRERELQREATNLGDSVRELRLADQEINAYLDRGGPQQLARASREIQSLRDELGRLETEQRQVTVRIKQIDEQLRSHTETQRHISDNLRYRRSLRDLEKVQQEIQALEAHNADADEAKYSREAKKWDTERTRLHAEQSGVFGTLKSKDDQLSQLIKDWENDYKDAAYKYKEAHIKVETTKAAVEDLARYGGALDKAIMKYHSLKMNEINGIIEELWKKTYQGTDVDTILIRSDSENVKGNKSYNYRVCMVKQDAEMDMRGRCSAGQKVLASIIIRLALAECFGTNCGIIALDEPTTNLDRENIQSLARSLAEIIRIRRQQANFQLIVITHDEKFLRNMQCGDFCDNYYRVFRNGQQKSEIEMQSIAQVV